MSVAAMPRDNNYDLIRLLLAASIFLFHLYPLTGEPGFHFLARMIPAELVISGFFVLSGYLVFQSYERAASLREYVRKRSARLLPAYVAVILICAFGLFFVSSSGFFDYFFSANWWRYLASNLVFLNFLEPTLPGVFGDHPHQAVNGALWTLKVEVMFYAGLPILAWFLSRLPKYWLLGGLYLASIAWANLCWILADQTGHSFFILLERQIPGQLAFFIAGMFFCFFKFERLSYPEIWLIAAIAILIFERLFLAPYQLLTPAALGYLVIYAGERISLGRKLIPFGDLSYGLYIWHFPVIQLLLHLHGPDFSVWSFVLQAVIISIAMAFLSWHYVEKPFLRRRLVRKETTAAAQPSSAG